MAKLLIIGNGFDLHCGLKSSYNDFFDYLIKIKSFKETYECIKKDEIIETPRGKRINIWWALLLAYHKEDSNYLWKDIESIMAAFLYESNENYEINIRSILKKTEHYYSRLMNEFAFSNIISQEPTMKFLWLLMRGNNLSDFYQPKKKFNDTLNIEARNISDIVTLIKKDLSEIESYFVEYLNSIHNAKAEIHEKANETYYRLLRMDKINGKNKETVLNELNKGLAKYNILSFNYTRLGQPNGLNYKYFKNIHGTFLGDYNDIIFGIDSFDMTPRDPFYFFTKTYRLSILENKLNNKPDIFDGKISLNDIKEIYIYGHSLDKQDYSYFYAIFNIADISNLDTKVTLFYSDYDDIDRSQERTLKLQQLIYDYEKEFNKPKGLYHRMLIEGRIGLSKI